MEIKKHLKECLKKIAITLKVWRPEIITIYKVMVLTYKFIRIFKDN